MGSQLKHKVLAAATSSRLLRIAAGLPDVAVYGLSQIPADPSQRQRPTYQRLQWSLLTQHVYEPLFLSLPQPHNGRHTPGPTTGGRLFMEISAKVLSLHLTSLIQSSFDFVHRDKTSTRGSKCWARCRQKPKPGRGTCLHQTKL